VVRSQFVRNDLHDGTFRTLVGSLEDEQLLDDVVGVLPGESDQLLGVVEDLVAAQLTREHVPAWMTAAEAG